MKINLTSTQLEQLRELKETTSTTWEEIGKEFGISGEGARDAYRREYGSKSKNGSQKTVVDPDSEKTDYTQGDGFINIICSSKRMLSKDDIINQFKIDLDTWEIERFRVSTSEGYRKDRQVEWDVEDGHTTHGRVRDSGKMLIVPLYRIEVRFIKKKTADAHNAIRDMIEDAKRFAPVYKKINYPKQEKGMLYEIAMFDVHFGRLTWDEESGDSYDIKLATKAIKSSLMKLLYYVKEMPIERILFPMGNDFFNVDNKFNTTTNGTPQQEDTRWQKTFRKGRELCVWMIDTCSQIAPVDVLIIPGNHDQQRAFYLGDSLESWYHNSKDVTINNDAMGTKYYSHGNTLLGFTHGADIKLEKLPFIMAYDQPDLWASTKYREWHTGDKHHKKDLIPMADESSGMVVRIIRSLVAFDAWTFNSGYRSIRASESFLWSKDMGLAAQYTALPDME